MIVYMCCYNIYPTVIKKNMSDEINYQHFYFCLLTLYVFELEQSANLLQRKPGCTLLLPARFVRKPRSVLLLRCHVEYMWQTYYIFSITHFPTINQHDISMYKAWIKLSKYRIILLIIHIYYRLFLYSKYKKLSFILQ